MVTPAVKLIVGIDPGSKGGIAVLAPRTNELRCWYMPVTHVPAAVKRNRALSVRDRRPTIDLIALRTLLRSLRREVDTADDILFVVEAVGAKFGDGIVQAFSFGYASAAVLMGVVAAGNGVKPALVVPSVWRPAMVGTAKEKSASIRRAHKLYPHYDFSLKKSEALAEAALIATYALQHLDIMLERRRTWPRSPEAQLTMDRPPRKRRKAVKKVPASRRASSPTSGRRASTVPRKGNRLQKKPTRS